jgi:hypothetical protein
MAGDNRGLATVAGVRVVDSRWQYGPKTVAAVRQGMNGFGSDNPLWSDPLSPEAHPSVLWPMRYYEIRASLWPGAMIGLPNKPVSPWVSAPAVPPGRNRLARYAQLIAIGDPAMIGDGGNNYAAMGEGLVEFMKQFRALPLRSFTRVPNTPASVAMRCSDKICYLVSLSPKGQSVSIVLPSVHSVRDLASGAPITSTGGVARIDLDAFSLRTIEANTPINAALVKVQSAVTGAP